MHKAVLQKCFLSEHRLRPFVTDLQCDVHFFDNVGKIMEMGRHLFGSSLFPDLKIAITVAFFGDSGNIQYSIHLLKIHDSGGYKFTKMFNYFWSYTIFASGFMRI